MKIKNYNPYVLIHEAGHAVVGIWVGLDFKKIAVTPPLPVAQFDINPYEVTNYQLLALKCAGRIAEKLLSQKTGQPNTPGSLDDDAKIKLINNFLKSFHGNMTDNEIANIQAKIEKDVSGFLNSHWGACKDIATHLDRYSSLTKTAMDKIRKKHRF